MKVREVMQLLKAGYTKDEINEMREQEKEEPAAEPIEEPEEPEEPHYADEISKLTAKLDALTNVMQDHFRKEAEGSVPDTKTGEQVLRDIIEKGVI